MLPHVKHQVLATKPAEPRVTLPIVVHSCHCSIPVRHHRCFLPPLLRFCPGFWRSHVLCLQLCLMRLVDEVVWSDTLDQTPWRTTFDVGEPLGVGDVDQNIPRSLIIQHILYCTCQFQIVIYVSNLTIHSSPPNQRPLQLLDVACQQPVVQFHRELKNNHQMPLNIPELSRWIYLFNHWHLDMQTHLYT